MILDNYFTRIRKAFLFLFVGLDGRLHLLVLCCAPNRKSATDLVEGGKTYRAIPIDAQGNCGPAEPLSEAGSLYFSHIQFAGVLEPKSGKSGIVRLPGTVIYNGMEESFLQSFSHFRENQALHIFSAVVFQPNSTLAVSKDSLIVGGKGHVTVIRATPLDPDGRDFEVSQYRPGESLILQQLDQKPVRNLDSATGGRAT